jgi:hypothetical protein
MRVLENLRARLQTKYSAAYEFVREVLEKVRARLQAKYPAVYEFVRDYRLPAVLAMGYVFLQRRFYPSEGNVFKDFGVSFFVFSWFFGQFFRIAQKQNTQKNFDILAENFDELVEKMDAAEAARAAQAEQLVNVIKSASSGRGVAEATEKLSEATHEANARSAEANAAATQLLKLRNLANQIDFMGIGRRPGDLMMGPALHYLLRAVRTSAPKATPEADKSETGSKKEH